MHPTTDHLPPTTNYQLPTTTTTTPQADRENNAYLNGQRKGPKGSGTKGTHKGGGGKSPKGRGQGFSPARSNKTDMKNSRRPLSPSSSVRGGGDASTHGGGGGNEYAFGGESDDGWGDGDDLTRYCA